jgi:hypothetical protein
MDARQLGALMPRPCPRQGIPMFETALLKK